MYQVGAPSFSRAKNLSGLNPGEQYTVAPALRLAGVAPISPCIWNSGMMFKHRSEAVSSRVFLILLALAQIFAWVRGTIFGRDVVPDV